MILELTKMKFKSKNLKKEHNLVYQNNMNVIKIIHILLNQIKIDLENF